MQSFRMDKHVRYNEINCLFHVKYNEINDGLFYKIIHVRQKDNDKLKTTHCI